MSDKLYIHFKNFIDAYTAQPLVVAYSGGLDSTVLLHLACRVRQALPEVQVRAVHIHHGLSPNADLWLAHCETQCQALDVAFFGQRVVLACDSRQSLEAVAREARYQAIRDVTPKDAHILLGQHQDDQLETFLLQLKRGAGPKGLSAMAARQVRAGRCYLRPLLEYDRATLEQYARQYNLRWIDDESNQDERFERNFLRHSITPLLKARWPSVGTTVSRSARLCAEQQLLLEEVSDERLALVAVADDCLDIRKLQSFSWLWQQQIIRLWLQKQQAQVPPEQLLQRLPGELYAAKPDAQPCLAWGSWQLRRFQQGLYLLDSRSLVQNVSQDWVGQAQLQLDDGRRLLFTQAQDGDAGCLYILPSQKVQVRFGEFSHAFCPMGQQHHKPLKQWLKLAHIPPWQRTKMPLLMVEDRLAAVAGWQVDRRFALPVAGSQAWRLDIAG